MICRKDDAIVDILQIGCLDDNTQNERKYGDLLEN